MKFLLKVSNKQSKIIKLKKNTFLNVKSKFKENIKFKNYLSSNKKLNLISISKNKNKIKFESIHNYEIIISGSPIKNGRVLNSSQILEIFFKNKNELFFISGTWVIIIYDNFTGKLNIFRDYLGVKPVYLLKKNNDIYLSSNIGLLIENNISNKKLDLEFTNIFLHCHPKSTFGRESTFFEDIKTFSPLYFMEINSFMKINLMKFYDEKYFKLKNFKNINKRKGLLFNINKFINSLLKNKKRIATSTSGGIDSGKILYHLKNLKVKKIESYSIVFGNKLDFDETNNSKILTNKFSSKHNLLNLNYLDIKNDLGKIYSNLDLPITTSSLYGFYFLYRKLKKYNYDYIFSGYGGNYLNAGTYPCYLFNFLDISKKKNFNNEFLKWRSIHNTKQNKKNKSVFRKFVNNHYEKSEKGRILDKFFFLTDKNLIKKKIFREKFRKNLKILNFGNYLDSYIHYALLYDSTSQAADLEDNCDWFANISTIFPLTDKSLVALGFDQKRDEQIKNGINRIKIRKEYKTKLPTSIILSPHTEGFKLPTNIWMRKELKKFLLKIIKSKKFNKIGLFNINNVKKIFNEHFANKNDNSMLIWLIINFYFWFEKWKPKI